MLRRIASSPHLIPILVVAAALLAFGSMAIQSTSVLFRVAADGCPIRPMSVPCRCGDRMQTNGEGYECLRCGRARAFE